MRPIRTLYILLTATCFALLSFREEIQDFIAGLKQQLLDYRQAHPNEKAYLQFDKTFYKPGEDIWFNAFVLDGQTHKPTAISDVLYVDLRDPKGNKVSSLTLFIHDGTTKGDFHLGDDAPGGMYTVTAHTQWMQNEGEETFFAKKLQVQNVLTPRLLLKADFEKKAYGKGDDVAATLTVKDLKNEPVTGARIASMVRIDGVTTATGEFSTDNEGKAAISFKLPHGLSTPDGILQLVVSAGGQQESITRAIPIVLNKIAIAFFPEGGDLVSAVENKVAFKATNEFGKGADVSGVVLDDTDRVVASFSSFHMGMGSFQLNPRQGVVYKARIDKPAGNDKLFALPATIESGYAVSFKKTSSAGIACTIHAPRNGDVFLVGQMHGVIYFAEKINLRKDANLVTIPTQDFPAGIGVFTLFNAEGLEEAERLVFLNGQKTLHVDIQTDKKTYSPREKVKVTIRTTDDSGRPVPAKLGLSAVDDQLISFADDKQDNILSWLLLSSELQGKIEEPSFYFDPKEPKAAEAIDNLMLTHGWRRFTWKDVLKNDPAVAWLPENKSVVSGYVINKRDKQAQSEVILLELGRRRKIAKVRTADNGSFTFKNFDASASVLLLTVKPNQIIVDSKNTSNQTIPIFQPQPGSDRPIPMVLAPTTGRPTPYNVAAGNIILEEDAQALQEVVVSGAYWSNTERMLAGSVATQTQLYQIETPPFTSPLTVLQGRVPGVEVQSQTASPGSAANVIIRGQNSLRGIQSPLFIIDGVPVESSVSANFIGETIAPENIASITVLKDAEATAIYGSRGSNGVIIVQTIYGKDFNRIMGSGKYNSSLVTPRQFSVTREFFSAPPEPSSKTQRNDFRTTVYWNQEVITDIQGEATVSFYNNDATSGFRLTAEGITERGLIGRGEQTYATALPFSLDTKIPQYLGFEDTLRLPVLIKNNLPEQLEGEVAIDIPEGLKVLTPVTLPVTVDPGKTLTHHVAIVPQGVSGTFPIKITIRSKKHSDEIKRELSVHPVGFQMRLSFSGKDPERDIKFDIRDLEKGSLRGDVTVYTDIIQDLFSGADAILSEPHGCFEQVSASTFPNILALQFMNHSDQLRPDTKNLALDYIYRGYKQLMAYEIDGGGFEWFGHPPAHEALTAYGLIEFSEMKKVSINVDEAMLQRTRKWILSRRKGDGTFLQNKGKYGFSSASEEVNNAYLVYALAETGTKDIDKEYLTSLSEAWATRDMYRMALMANTAHNLGHLDNYRKLIAHFATQVSTNGFDRLKADHSVVRSYGNSLAIETAAFWCLALMKASDTDLSLVRQGIDFILSKRSFGTFGSTQATTLALKALTEYAILVQSEKQGGDVFVTANNRETDISSFTKDTRKKLVLDKFAGVLGNGQNSMAVRFRNTSEALRYSINVSWNTKTPITNADCKIRLETNLRQPTLKINETVRLVTTLRNISHEGVPMTVALIGIPAGLSLQPWQLKDLQEKHTIDFYEILGDRLAIYFRELEPNAKRTINLDLKAEVSGSFTGVASCAYLYYTDEYKDWVRGSTVAIQ